MEAVKERTTEYFILIQRQEVIRRTAPEEPECIPLPLAKAGKTRIRPVLARIALKTLKTAAFAFWLVFMGGFLVVAGSLAAACLRLCMRSFFSALDNHNYLWYMSAVWKRNP